MRIYVELECQNVAFQWRFRVMSVILIRTLFNEAFWRCSRASRLFSSDSFPCSWPALNTRIVQLAQSTPSLRLRNMQKTRPVRSPFDMLRAIRKSDELFSRASLASVEPRSRSLLECAVCVQWNKVQLTWISHRKIKANKTTLKRSSDFFLSHPSWCL